MGNLPRRVKILIGVATLLGLGCVAIRVPEIVRWDAEDLLAVALIAAFTIAAERCSIPLHRGTETVNFALTDGVWAGALLLVAPGVLTVAILLGVGIGQALNRWKPFKIAYNVSQFLIGITLAEIAFALLGGWGAGPTDPLRWLAALAAMSLMFVVNASAITLVVSMVEGTRFLDVFRLPLAINVLHWLGNMALGILAAISWAIQPATLFLMLAPVSLAYLTYRRWVTSILERNQALDLYEAGRALAGPIASREDFGDFLRLLEKLLPADRVELVVVEDGAVAVHTCDGVRHLTVDADADPLEAFVAVRSDVAPQISLVGDGDDVRGVLAVYRAQVLTATERLLLDGLAGQVAARLRNHRLYGKTLERARLSEIVTHTSDGVFTVDPNGLITTWNPAMSVLLGFTEAEALGRRCDDLLGLEEIGALSGGGAGDGESSDAMVRTKDGSSKALRLRTGAIRDEEGAPPARIVVVRDAGEERKAEQIKQDFVSMVSHELRSPLTPLRGFLSSLVEGTVEDDPDTRLEYYRIMLRQAQRLERVVNDMLDASLIEAGGLVVDLQPAPLDHVLGRIVREFREQRPDRPVVLHEAHRPSIVFADPFRVEQVVLNLLSNADKYTPEGLPIDVSTETWDGSVTVSVRDIGPGIPIEHRDLIFDRFYRVKDGAAAGRPGTGLGLYIAKTLVEAMSGRIWVDSGIGIGTTFSFSLQTVDVDRHADSPLEEMTETTQSVLVRMP
ncbi:MAG TPA: ATP-binding protein [Actinomycetota bacterium]|nr:ATP-binding protein [Actinomycetota bacterium]